jgi:hypothetical protein
LRFGKRLLPKTVQDRLAEMDITDEKKRSKDFLRFG